MKRPISMRDAKLPTRRLMRLRKLPTKLRAMLMKQKVKKSRKLQRLQ